MRGAKTQLFARGDQTILKFEDALADVKARAELCRVEGLRKVIIGTRIPDLAINRLSGCAL